MRKDLVYQNPIDRVNLHGYLEFDENSKKGLVMIMHGMAEHKERYDYFVKKLVNDGFAVLNCDERGHGESAVVKGQFASQDGWFRNVEDLYHLYLLSKEIIDLPLIVFGHSMGTLVARSFLKRYEKDITKVIMTGMASYNSAVDVAIVLAKTIKTFKGETHRSKLLNSLSFGSYNSEIDNPKTEFDWLSVNEDNVKEYLKNDDCGYIFTVSGYLDLFKGMKDAYSSNDWSVKKKELPIHFLSGAADPCMGKEKGKEYAINALRKVGYQNISFKTYPNLRHEILNEKERDVVIADILEYLNK